MVEEKKQRNFLKKAALTAGLLAGTAGNVWLIPKGIDQIKQHKADDRDFVAAIAESDALGPMWQLENLQHAADENARDKWGRYDPEASDRREQLASIAHDQDATAKYEAQIRQKQKAEDKVASLRDKTDKDWRKIYGIGGVLVAVDGAGLGYGIKKLLEKYQQSKRKKEDSYLEKLERQMQEPANNNPSL